jgi:hypothetical protein
LVLKSTNENKETKSNGFLMTGVIVLGLIIGQETETKEVTPSSQISTPTLQQTFVEVKQVSTEATIQPISTEANKNMSDNEAIINNLEQATKIETMQSDVITIVDEAEAEAEAEAEIITESEVAIKEEIEALDFNLLELDTQIDMNMDINVINTETNNIKNQLLYFEQQLGVIDNNEPGWNKTEQMMLNTKRKLKALEEKLKLEGDWGKIRLKLDPKEQYQKLNLKYQYGF